QAAPTIALTDVDRLLILGSQRLVRQMHDAKRNELAPYFCKTGHTIASVNAPMQCMLKGVCSQCLQWQIDPATGKRTKAIFGCSWQDQPLEMLDLDNLDERLSQNRLQEILADLWLDYLTAKQPLERA
ncbi:MAG: pyridine nucleotide-disulfide oxidoreductase, partial [Sulfurifustis sp.]